MESDRVPFVDLGAQYASIKDEIDDAMALVIRETSFVGGAHVTEFARAFAAAMGGGVCVPVANGTDALFIILRMLDVGGGDEVIVPAISWIASSEVVTAVGAKPVFVDVDDYFHMDPVDVREKTTDRTKVILPVHLYGQPADLGALLDFSQERDILLVEDCAQAHLAAYRGCPVGLFGVAAGFSFYPGKNLGAYGDAGGILTSDAALADRCRMFANHGQRAKHDHQMEGMNSRLDGLQAAILSVKLKYLKDWTAARRRVASWYDALLEDVPEVVTPRLRDGCSHVYHLYVVEAENRDALDEHLKRRGICTGVHYPAPLPFLPAYAHLEHRPGDFPRSLAVQSRILSLPMYAELPKDSAERVAMAIREFYGR